MSQKGVFEYLSAFSKRIMRELYPTLKKSFQRNRQRVSKNSLSITYSIESIFSEQTKNIACITFKIKIFGRKNMTTYAKSPAILFCMPPKRTMKNDREKKKSNGKEENYVRIPIRWEQKWSKSNFFFSNILVMMVKDVSIHNSSDICPQAPSKILGKKYINVKTMQKRKKLTILLFKTLISSKNPGFLRRS